MNTTNAAKMYTPIQAAEMAELTMIDGTSRRALVRNHDVAESDERFFMDREWLAWFADTHPEWVVVSMHDAYDLGRDEAFIWTVSLRK